jgi:ATP-dependent Zn protease
MNDFITAISYVAIGIYFTVVYKYLSLIEPFCFYLPGGIGRYYKVHKDIKTKFSDVVGSEEIKEELKAHLKYFTLTQNLSKGFLFQGVSGTGKTNMARAVAGESDLPFVEIFSNDLREANIPTVLNAVIKKYSPCIIFIDECENIMNGFSDTLLRKFDGIDSINNIFLILATTGTLNVAMSRSGRIDKVINFGLPTYNDRLEMFNKMGFKKASKLAQQTTGLTYADLSIIPREIEFLEIVQDINKKEALPKVINRLKFGRHTSQIKPDEILSMRLAYHEIGHLLMSYILKGVAKPNKVTTTPIGKFGGSVSFNTKDLIYKTRSEIIKEIVILLASSVFEKHYLEEYSTLCEDDFEKVDKLFKVLENSKMLGYNMSFDDRNDHQVNLLEKCEAFIKDCIINYDTFVNNIYNELIIKETLNEKEIKEILGHDIYDKLDLPDF